MKSPPIPRDSIPGGHEIAIGQTGEYSSPAIGEAVPSQPSVRSASRVPDGLGEIPHSPDERSPPAS
jgi:hypothetical protein